MMKLLFSMILLAAIFLSYYLLSSLLGKAVTAPVNTLSFTESGAEIRKLEAFSAYEDIAQSPLFDTDRKPEKIEVKKKVVYKKPVQKDLTVKALGIAITGESILAVIKDMKNGKIIRLRINEEIYGWALKGVSTDSFVFSKGEIEKAIRFRNSEE
jgi:hypothetical protein